MILKRRRKHLLTEPKIKKKILLGDNEEHLLLLVQATLQGDERYDVLIASNGEQALTIALHEKPDILFLDINMPRMNGYEVCQRLKTTPETAHCKIVMLTAMAQDSDRQKAIESGADDYFTKPFSPTALLNKVDEILG